MTTTLVKAVILNLEHDGQSSRPREIRCLFNPREYTFSKSNAWSREMTAAGNVPQMTFGGGQPTTLAMELFFDTYAQADTPDRATDVRRHTDPLWDLLYVDERARDGRSRNGRPPLVRFQWGASWSFDAVISSITQRFTLFRSDGTPVRATLQVSFTQVRDERWLPKQNPTSGGRGGERLHVVQAGESLASIAAAAYGDPSRWRDIARENQLEGVRDLKPGARLVIPGA